MVRTADKNRLAVVINERDNYLEMPAMIMEGDFRDDIFSLHAQVKQHHVRPHLSE